MARALIEGLSFICRQVLEGTEGFMGSDLFRIIVCGGGMRNKAWCGIKADITQRELSLVTMEETTALGAALKAGVGTGIYASDEEAVSAVSKETVSLRGRPEAAEVYDRLYPLFERLYHDLKDIHHALFDLGL
jgi:xylulokinase